MYNYSIIIPHYNITPLLLRCIHSIPQRDDVQIIIVDDQSPNYEEIKEEILKLSRDNVELYKTDVRKGGGHARNIGLEHAKGKWLLFADADDFFNPCINDILDEYIECNSDIIFFASNSLDTDTYRNSDRDKYYCSLIDDYFKTGNDYDLRYKFDVPWAKIIRNSMVRENGIRFQETIRSNDVAFSYLTGYHASTIKADKRALYCVTSREESTSRNESFEALKDRLFVMLTKYRFMQEKGLNPDYPVHISSLLGIAKKSDYDINVLFSMAKNYGISKRCIYFNYFLYNIKKNLRNLLH